MSAPRVLLARMKFAEWMLVPKRVGFPGQRIVTRIGNVEIERMFGDVGSVTRLRTGGWYRRHGFTGDQGRLDRLRLTVPWVGGSLWIMAAPEQCEHS